LVLGFSAALLAPKDPAGAASPAIVRPRNGAMSPPRPERRILAVESGLGASKRYAATHGRFYRHF
jgi:hypothetical protein